MCSGSDTPSGTDEFLLHFSMPRPRNQVPIPVFRAESEFDVNNAEFRAPGAKKQEKTKLIKLIFHVFGHNSAPVSRIGTKLGGNEALDLPKLPIQSRAHKNEEKMRKTRKTKINL